MFNLSETNKYNLFTQGVDMRKGVESLCGIVRTNNMNPVSGEVYVFGSRDSLRIAPHIPLTPIRMSVA